MESSNKSSADRRNFLRNSGAAGVGLLASLNSSVTFAQADAQRVRIGAALPMTGASAADGIEFERGLKLAAKEINEAGGVLGRRIEILVEDTSAMGAANVSQAMQRLIDRYQVSAIVNGYNVATNMVEMDVAADNNVILVHYNTTVAHNKKVLTHPERYYGCFQGCPPEYWYGPGFLNFLATLEDSGKWKRPNNKLAVIPSANEYSVTIANAIREFAGKHGYTVSLFETVPFPNNQWGPVLAKLRADPPAAIAITHFLPQDLAQFMTQFVPNPTNSLIYMQYGPSLPAFREIGGKAVAGTIYSTVVGALPDEFAKPFYTRYFAEYGKNSAPLTGSQTYDGLWQWALAAAIAGGPGAAKDATQNKKVAKALRELIYRGVNGTTRFIKAEQSAYCYPTQIGDPSLGMPHQFLQHQDLTKPPALIGPTLYKTSEFAMPPWVKKRK
jgi:branched-chain amino acid transport system substrate-binding protein